MNKADIIAKTLADMSRHEQDERYEAEVIIPTLNERVPEGDSKTCEDFNHLNVECCENCHTFYPHYEMEAIDLPGGGKAWICHTVRRALLLETGNDEQSPEMELLVSQIFGHKKSEQ